MNSTSAMLLARARQDELLRAAERRPQRHSPAHEPKPASRRIELPRWFRFPRLAGT